MTRLTISQIIEVRSALRAFSQNQKYKLMESLKANKYQYGDLYNCLKPLL